MNRSAAGWLGFSAKQPDLGTKWAPRFVRIVTALPLTATGKITKAGLRRERWSCDDGVIWRPERGENDYRFLRDEDLMTLEQEFGRHGGHSLCDGVRRTRRPMPRVGLMGADDVNDVATSLAAAFEDDPVWEYLVPDSASRTRRLITIFATMIRNQHLPLSASYTDLGRLGGALWDPPGHWRMTPSQLLRSSPGFIKGFGTNAVKAGRTLSTIEQGSPEVWTAFLPRHLGLPVPINKAEESAPHCFNRFSSNVMQKGSGRISNPRRKAISRSMCATGSRLPGKSVCPRVRPFGRCGAIPRTPEETPES